jgi:hypothetical protein
MNRVALLGALIASSVACARVDAPGERAPLDKASYDALYAQLAVDVAVARCDRELRCGRIAATGAAVRRCVAAFTPESLDLLYVHDCSQGVAVEEAAGCTVDIRYASCDVEARDLRRLDRCWEHSFCMGEVDVRQVGR